MHPSYPRGAWLGHRLPNGPRCEKVWPRGGSGPRGVPIVGRDGRLYKSVASDSWPRCVVRSGPSMVFSFSRRSRLRQSTKASSPSGARQSCSPSQRPHEIATVLDTHAFRVDLDPRRLHVVEEPFLAGASKAKVFGVPRGRRQREGELKRLDQPHLARGLPDRQGGYVHYWWYGELNWQGAGGEKRFRERLSDLVAE